MEKRGQIYYFYWAVGGVYFLIMGAKRDDEVVKQLAGIMAEQFDDQLARIVENIDGRIEHHLKPIKEDITELKTDVKAVKAAVKDTNHDLSQLNFRVDDHDEQFARLRTQLA